MKKLILLLMLALTIFAFCLYYGEEPKNSRQLFSETVYIGTETWPGYIGLYIAEDKNFFREKGLNVTIKKYLSLSKLSQDYTDGLLHGRANLTFDAVKEMREGLAHKIVLVLDYSKGADAIITNNPAIRSVKDFTGKKIAYEPGTLEEFFLHWLLTRYEVEPSSITSVPADPKQSVTLLQNHKVDVSVTHEPFLSHLSSSFLTVVSSKETPKLITDVLSFHESFIQKNPATIEAIIEAYFQAIEFLKKNPEECYQLFAKRLESKPEDIARYLEGIDVVDLRGNHTAFSFSSGTDSLYGNVREVNYFMEAAYPQRKATKLYEVDGLLEPRFIRRLFHQKHREVFHDEK